MGKSVYVYKNNNAHADSERESSNGENVSIVWEREKEPCQRCHYHAIPIMSTANKTYGPMPTNDLKSSKGKKFQMSSWKVKACLFVVEIWHMPLGHEREARTEGEVNTQQHSR